MTNLFWDVYTVLSDACLIGALTGILSGVLLTAYLVVSRKIRDRRLEAAYCKKYGLSEDVIRQRRARRKVFKNC